MIPAEGNKGGCVFPGVFESQRVEPGFDRILAIAALKRMRLKIKAATAEGRASALILTAAPFLAAGAIILLSPEFYGDVMHLPMVRIGLIVIGACRLGMLSSTTIAVMSLVIDAMGTTALAFFS